MPEYRDSLLDWMACARGGRREPAVAAAARVANSEEGRALVLGTAGHVLDFDDTYTPGLVHLSAPVAPAALVAGAASSATVSDVLDAYAYGFEAMAALARACHPALYERGWHPTAVCGAAGAAAAVSRLVGLDRDGARRAAALALLHCGGVQAAFGSDGKSLQVGMAAAAALVGARLAAAGASVPDDLAPAIIDVHGGAWAEPGGERALDLNWIKAYPCCLQTHSAIDAAGRARAAGVVAGTPVRVTVHPLSRRAAPFDDVDTGLRAKFSIAYTVAHTLLRGPPVVESFGGVDADVRAAARAVSVETDPGLGESGAVLEADGTTFDVSSAPGSPERPMDAAALAAKRLSLAGDSLEGALDDDAAPAARLIELIGVLAGAPT